MNVRCGPPSVQVQLAPAPAPSTMGGGRCLCAVGLLALVLIAIWSCWSSNDSNLFGAPLQGANVAGAPAAALEPATAAAQRGLPTRPFNSPHGKLPPNESGTGGCSNPQAPQAPQAPRLGADQASSGLAAMAIPGRVSGAFAGTVSGGAALDSLTYGLSEDSSEYYKHFKPVSLESTMPLGWRAQDGAEKCASEDLYSEFSRYAITPSQMKRAEGVRSVLRLSESSRDGLSRTLGQRSLLRDFVTPLGPSPIGDAAMLFNDSSVRQNYIASATGRFPEVSKGC